MMTVNMKLNGSKVQLDGNILTGDTYRIKEFIKSNLGGKWDGERKGWIVDAAKMSEIMNSGWCYIFPSSETTSPSTTNHNCSGICPRCHTYCDGDCRA